LNIKQLLLFPILIALAFIPTFADDENLIIKTDKGQYHTGEELTVSGFIEGKKCQLLQ